jgi:hypothetical protein
MLTGSRFGNDPPGAQPDGQKCLAYRIIDLVGSGVG